MKILLTEVEYTHLVQSVRAFGYNYLDGGFGISSFRFDSERIGRSAFAPMSFWLEVDGKLSLQGWDDFIKHIRSL